MCGCISCLLSCSPIEEMESEGSILDFSTRWARKTRCEDGKLGCSCPFRVEVDTVLRTGRATGADKLSLSWSRLGNWHLDSWLMFSGSMALDLKDPRVFEVPFSVFFRIERVALMLRGSIRVMSRGSDFTSAKALCNSEIWAKWQQESLSGNR